MPKSFDCAAAVRRRTARAVAVCSVALLSACATVNAGADFEPGVRLDQYRTFDWAGGDSLPVGDPRLDNNPFFDSRVRAAVELEFAARGLNRSTVSPDLVVHYHASVRQRVDVIRADEGRGYSSPRDGRSEQVLEYEEGTLIVDVAEPKAKAILWRGWAQTDVGGMLNDPREMEKRIRESVRKMMLKFPR
ncbi:DUF4136 domain-containing protein [Gemmatimonas sp.]|jgi:hypothetical protein|uniref:DUF4136 domain-containing protein n=1 Tax=Gemmatimonas sp. TaxID=1962908 RepID=UPI0037C13B03